MAEQVTLSALERTDEFVRRHIGPDEAQIGAMLEVVQARSLDDLVDQATPVHPRRTTSSCRSRSANGGAGRPCGGWPGATGSRSR